MLQRRGFKSVLFLCALLCIGCRRSTGLAVGHGGRENKSRGIGEKIGKKLKREIWKVAGINACHEGYFFPSSVHIRGYHCWGATGWTAHAQAFFRAPPSVTKTHACPWLNINILKNGNYPIARQTGMRHAWTAESTVHMKKLSDGQIKSCRIEVSIKSKV